MTIRLTQYSHGAGCGCKIAPDVLDRILHTTGPQFEDPRVLVGNKSRDDAAVVDMGNGLGVISTTDFFMPVVDDPFDFGRIAAANAISDVYAMGGEPVMAIAILGWPVNVLAPEVAGQVLDGARQVCHEAGIMLAGGHSIDAPEPIFGLAVTGRVSTDRIVHNDTAREGDLLYLTKPLGVGIVTSAAKKEQVSGEDLKLAVATMAGLNKAGQAFANIEGVHAMTDVTGFGLLGHLLEICRGSGLAAEVNWPDLPVLPNLDAYIAAGCVPGGTRRNAEACSDWAGELTDSQKQLLCDPQTSGGLLVAVEPASARAFEAAAAEYGLKLKPFGRLTASAKQGALVSVHEG